MISPLAVAKAYAAVQNQATAATGAAPEAAGGFADILKSAIGDAMQASKTAETQMV